MRSFLAALLLFISGSALAVEPDEILSDPALEARARIIDTQLRCVVCQSQSIAESDAPLAKDLRVLVRERLTAGDTDRQVIAYVVDRYGDYVLLKPPVQQNTIFLWLFPGLMVLAGFTAAMFYIRHERKTPVLPALSDEEELKVRRIIDERS